MSSAAAGTPYELIGVDGGATEVKAHLVRCDVLSPSPSFALGEISASRTYERLSEFAPVPVAEQLRQRDAGEIKLDAKEMVQGSVWVQAACDAIAEVAERACGDGRRLVLLGMGMPGLKTADGRGICVINNGPRIPDFLAQLERRLAECGVELVAPVAALGSDADYCGVGELHADAGLFRGVSNAYYAGCGTGIADALLLGGRLVTFDAARTWLQKSWQIPSAVGPTFEKLVSAKSMNDVYARLRGADATGEARYPEREALRGDALARAWMETVALVLAELIFERLDTIRNGRADLAHRGEPYAGLNTAHPYRGVTLDRIVLGQRLGQLYADEQYHAVFGGKLDAALAALIGECGGAEMVEAYLDGGRLRPGLMCASRLRAAPALGAAVAAMQAYSGDRP